MKPFLVLRSFCSKEHRWRRTRPGGSSSGHPPAGDAFRPCGIPCQGGGPSDYCIWTYVVRIWSFLMCVWCRFDVWCFSRHSGVSPQRDRPRGDGVSTKLLAPGGEKVDSIRQVLCYAMLCCFLWVEFRWSVLLKRRHSVQHNSKETLFIEVLRSRKPSDVLYMVHMG